MNLRSSRGFSLRFFSPTRRCMWEDDGICAVFCVIFVLSCFPLFFAQAAVKPVLSDGDACFRDSQGLFGEEVASSEGSLIFKGSCPSSDSIWECSLRVFNDAIDIEELKHASIELKNGNEVFCSFSLSSSEAGGEFKSGGINLDDSSVCTCRRHFTAKPYTGKTSELKLQVDYYYEEIDQATSQGDSLHPQVEIIPASLDWGVQHMYSGSLSCLSVKNLHEGFMDVYEPLTTNPQYYSYNFSNFSLAPGKTALITFVFLPRLLGVISAQIVFQTSFGGFILHAQGTSVESPYSMVSFLQFGPSLEGKLLGSVSLYSPFDRALEIEEPSYGFTIKSENRTQSLVVTCSAASSFESVCEFVTIQYQNAIFKIKEIGQELVGFEIMPYLKSEVHPYHSEEVARISNERSGSLGGIMKRGNYDSLKSDSEFLLRSWGKSQGVMRGISVLKDKYISFPLVQVGSQYSKWITVSNPSDKAVLVQLFLKSSFFIDSCCSCDYSSNHDFRSRPTFIDSSLTQNIFTIGDVAQMEAIVHPLGNILLGPIVFSPSKCGTWRSSAFVRNNLTGIEWFHLHASSRFDSILLFEGSKPVRKLEFRFNLFMSMNLTSTTYSSNDPDESNASCSHILSKDLLVRNTGELPVQMMKPKVSGTICASDGFTVQNCEAFTLLPGQSMKLQIFYHPDFSTSSAIRHDLELVTMAGITVIPMEACVPIYVFDSCSKYFPWKLVTDAVALLLGIGLLLFMALHFFSRTAFLDILCRLSMEKNVLDIDPSPVQHFMRPSRSVKGNKEIVTNGRGGGSVVNKKGFDFDQKITSSSQESYKKSSEIPISSSGNSAFLEPAPNVNLTVQITKRGRRRHKQIGGGGGLASKFEVSSSQSGNSTPSSPLSPAPSTPPDCSQSCFTKEKTDDIGNKYDKICISTEPTEPKISKELCSPSLTARNIPGWVSSPRFTASSSPVAPHSRAPGSNLRRERAIENLAINDDNDLVQKKFTYDIWGNHNSSESELVSSKVLDASEGDSLSFFARDSPFHLMMMSSTHCGASTCK